MPKKSSLTIKKGDVSPAEYTKFIASLMAKIRSAQIKAAIAVNSELIKSKSKGADMRGYTKNRSTTSIYIKILKISALLLSKPKLLALPSDRIQCPNA